MFTRADGHVQLNTRTNLRLRNERVVPVTQRRHR